ncbi:MAG: GH3 auxin-responsive promoter family protein [Candidatus Thorarchaeota archaeon]
MKHIHNTLNNPVECSEQELLSVLERHRNTVFGRKHDFANIRTPEDFSRKVPLSDYQSVKPYLDRVYENPRGGILTSDPVVWYLKTSGSSGQPKVVPTTSQGLKQASKGGSALWLSFIDQHPSNIEILDGSMLLFGAPAIVDYINDIPFGYASGCYARHQNKIFSRLIAPREDVLNITDIDEKMRAYAEIASQNSITALQGIATLNLAFVWKMQEQYGPWLLKLLRGTKHEQRIRSALDSDGRLDVGALWPELQLFVVGGVDTDPHREWIHRTLPNVTIWEAYAASEGFIGSQVLPGKGVQLLPDLNYLEFIPEAEVELPEPTVIPLSDVKKGCRYELVITNVNGWYRYRLGDMVTFSETDPYTVRHISRLGGVVNLAGEKITEAHVARALYEACKDTGAEIVDYSLVGMTDERVPYYVLAVMFRTDLVSPKYFVSLFEKAIMKSNYEFYHSRAMGGLGPTRIRIMKSSFYEDIVRKTHVQAKPIHLTIDTSVLARCESQSYSSTSL